MKIQHGLYAGCIAIGTLLACWLAADYTAAVLVGDKLAQAVSAEEAAAGRTAEAMVRAIDADMAVMRAIPPTLSEVDLVRGAPSGADGGTSAQGTMSRVNNFLQTAGGYLAIDRIWLLNAQGRCVAASDYRDSDTVVGKLLADRDYFNLAMLGGRFEGLRIDHAGAPALFFSAPVYRDGLLTRVIAIKIGMTRLQHWVSTRESLVADANGVVILASRPALEMHRMPDATVAALSVEQRNAFYHQSEFSPLPLMPYQRRPGRANAWVPQDLLARMVNFDGRAVPYVVREREIASSGLKAITIKDVKAWPEYAREHSKDVVLFFLLYAGMVVIVALVGWIYLRERAVRRQTLRSNEAPRTANSQLAFEASYDELTGSLTRRYFFHRFEQMLARTRSQDAPLGLIVADLDHFKAINDTHGHTIGDKVLCRFVLACSSVLRSHDVIGRIGGEEFAILLPGANERDALRVAERMRACCKRAPPENAALSINFTATFGITVDEPDDTPMTMIERADIALYRAKKAGRDRCWVL